MLQKVALHCVAEVPRASRPTVPLVDRVLRRSVTAVRDAGGVDVRALVDAAVELRAFGIGAADLSLGWHSFDDDIDKHI
jgi:hypothetical protein